MKKVIKSCKHPKHVFRKHKGKCECGRYYKERGRIFREKGDTYVAGCSRDFVYKRPRKEKKAKKNARR